MLPLNNFLNRFFSLSENNTSIRQEFIGALTTFLAMCYIIFVNPAILGQAGMPASSVFTATCLVVVIACIMTGLYANTPIAIAPSMGLNAYFTYVIVQKLGFSWDDALLAVFIAGCLFFALTVFKIRQWIVASIPPSISVATAAGIGLFIGLIGLKNAHIVISNPSTIIQLGNLHSFSVLSSLLGLVAIAILDFYQISGSIVIVILAISILAIFTGNAHYYGIISSPPSIAPTFFKFDSDKLFAAHDIMIIFTFFIVALFDSTGTLSGLFREIGAPQSPKTQEKIGKTLLCDSASTLIGSFLGTSTMAAYVENATGIRAGARTGLAAIFIGLFFALALWFSPIARMVPLFATTPALLYVACLMLKHIADIEWQDITIAIPATITMIMIPLSFSIANGIGLGILSYVLIKLFCGKWREINLMLWAISILYLFFFAYGIN